VSPRGGRFPRHRWGDEPTERQLHPGVPVVSTGHTSQWRTGAVGPKIDIIRLDVSLDRFSGAYGVGVPDVNYLRTFRNVSFETVHSVRILRKPGQPEQTHKSAALHPNLL